MDTPNYYYNTTYMNPHDAAISIGATLIILLFTFIFVAVVYVIVSFLLSRIFKKAGVAPWIAWVPFYNTWKTLELGNQQGFWAVLAIIPIVNYVSIVFVFIAMYHIGLKFGKSGAWVVLAIFLPIVWYAILAFDSSKWQETKSVA